MKKSQYINMKMAGESVEDFHAALKATVEMINKPFAERLQGGKIIQPQRVS